MSRSLEESFVLQACNIVMDRLVREFAPQLATLDPHSEEAAKIYNRITMHGFAAKLAAEKPVQRRSSHD